MSVNYVEEEAISAWISLSKFLFTKGHALRLLEIVQTACNIDNIYTAIQSYPTPGATPNDCLDQSVPIDDTLIIPYTLSGQLLDNQYTDQSGDGIMSTLVNADESFPAAQYILDVRVDELTELCLCISGSSYLFN